MLAAIVEGAGASYVDGGIIGPPPRQPGDTRLYLSGERADEVASWFTHGVLEAVAIGDEPTAASALKMCYAAGTKGISALLLAIRAASRRLGVEAALAAEWDLSQPEFVERFDHAVASSRKAWRFEGEMCQIQATLESVGLPGGFHGAAAEVFAALHALKDVRTPTWEAVASELRRTR
jgi:hypothetical protein